MGARRERALLHEKLLSEFSKLQVKKKSTDLPSLSLNRCWNWQAERQEFCSDSQVEGEGLSFKRGKNSYIVRIKNIYH